MNVKVIAAHHERKDNFKFVLIGLLFIAGVVLQYRYGIVSWVFRLLGWLALVFAMLAIAYTTDMGKQLLAFMQEAITEMRKVIWPTRQEAIQTAVAVVLMVAAMSVLLWIIDTIWFRLVGLVVEHRIS